MRFCEENDLTLDQPTDEQYAAISLHLTPEVRTVLTVEGSLASRNGAGGTAPKQVALQLESLVARLRAASL